jgi:diaminopimelate epimerase
MQALGNDFIVINTINRDFIPNSSQIRALSDRHFGVGFDQMLVISAAKNQQHHYFYQIFNADGSEVGQCGNGARCAFRYIKNHLNPKIHQLRLATKTTTLELEEVDSKLIKMSLPPPKFQPSEVPILAQQESKLYELQAGIEVHALSVGNPHAIFLVANHLWQQDLDALGFEISHHSLFPEQVNANFMQIESSSEISLRVFERGVGETLACGSGALASAIAGMKFHHLNEKVLVKLKGGDLIVHWPNKQGPVYQYGPAQEVFTGQLNLL